MRRKREKKGISTIVAAMFMVAVIIVGLNALTWGMNLQNNFGGVITERGIMQAEQSSEAMELRDVKIESNDRFNMTLANTGALPVKLVRMWVTNTTDTNGWHQKYDLDNVVNPGETTYLGQDPPLNQLIAMNSSSYKINVVTERGTSANFQILSAKDKPLRMNLVTTPQSINHEQEVTILLSVTNNLTDGSLVQSVRPQTPLNWTATEVFGGTIAATPTLVEGPTPTSEDSLTLGETAFFKWIYKIKGDEGDKISFNATIVDAPTNNYVAEEIEVVIDQFSKSSSSVEVEGINVAATQIIYSAFGDVSFAKGTFAKSTTTGSQSISTVGFQPKALILFTTGQVVPPEGFDDTYKFAVGFASSATEEKTVGVMALDNSNNHDSGRKFADMILTIPQDGDPYDPGAEADLTSFDANGFTLNWTVNDDSLASEIHYIAFGSSNLTNAKVGAFTAGGAGNQAVTGLGFRPDYVMFLATADSSAPGTSKHINTCIGFATSSSGQGATAFYSRDNSDSEKIRNQRTDRVVISFTEPQGNIDGEASFVSMDSDGFTINWIDSPAGSDSVYYLALKGGSYDVGNFKKTTAAAPIAQNVTGVGFKPSGVMLSTFNNMPDDRVITLNKVSLGAGDGTNEGSIWAADRNNAANSITARSHLTTKIIRTATEEVDGANDSLVDAEADLQSLDPDGFSLNWTTNDATIYPGGNFTFAVRNTGVSTMFVDSGSRASLVKIDTNATYVGFIIGWINETSSTSGPVNATMDSDGIEPGDQLTLHFTEPKDLPGVQSTGTSVLTDTGKYNAYIRLNGYDAQGKFVLKVIVIGVVVV